jgi:hypothetical protein
MQDVEVDVAQKNLSRRALRERCSAKDIPHMSFIRFLVLRGQFGVEFWLKQKVLDAIHGDKSIHHIP